MIEILQKVGANVYIPYDVKCNIADEILALGWYPKEFVEWKEFNTFSKLVKRDKYLYILSDIDSPLNEFTLDELYNYWLKEVKK
jgi:hypothetical protein